MCPHTERHSGLAWASRGSWPLSTACPKDGPHGRLKSWLPWAQGESCPRSPGQSDPWGREPVGSEGQVGLVHLLLPHSVKYLLSTYFVSGVGIRREEEVGFRLGKRQAYPQALIK